jgi:hypothetical protein
MRTKRALVVAAAVLAAAPAAHAANTYSVSRAQVTPGTAGNPSSPTAVKVLFGLRAGEEDPTKRAAPIKTYMLASEGLVVDPRPFARCSLRQLKRRKGVPRRCAKAKVGTGVARGAAGLDEDPLLESSTACNLRLAVYNTGAGLALRLDGQPPVPPSLNSRRFGCPVPVHTAIKVSLSKIQIDGVESSELRFTLPRLLLHPLDGWDAALRVVDVTLDRRRSTRGRALYGAAGCNGGERTVQVGFVDEQGTRATATRTIGC